MKFISWNVNGLRACLGKGFLDFFQSAHADLFCIQETKMQEGQAEINPEGYFQYWNSADKKGYSGTAIFTKQKPLSVAYDMGIDEHDHEGRVITLEFERFYMVNVYTPNSQRGLARLEYRQKWEDDFLTFVMDLDKKKPVVLCGDLNVAHKEIDLFHPKSNTKNAGFTPEERGKMTAFLEAGFVDSFRSLYPDLTGAYSWWSYMANAREKNVGWRIDYFICSKTLTKSIKGAKIYPEVMGSDHCPVELVLDFDASSN